MGLDRLGLDRTHACTNAAWLRMLHWWSRFDIGHVLVNWIHVCTYIYIYIYVYVHIYIYIYIYVYTIYIYIYTYYTHSTYIYVHTVFPRLVRLEVLAGDPRPGNTVGFHNFNLRIFNLRVSNPNKFIVDAFLTRCRISMRQSLGPKNHDEISEIDCKVILKGPSNILLNKSYGMKKILVIFNKILKIRGSLMESKQTTLYRR